MRFRTGACTSISRIADVCKPQGQLAPGMAGAQQLTQFLSRKWPEIVPASEWAFGKTMIFVHSPQTIFVLQELMEEARDPKGYAEKIKAAEEGKEISRIRDLNYRSKEWLRKLTSINSRSRGS